MTTIVIRAFCQQWEKDQRQQQQRQQRQPQQQQQSADQFSVVSENQKLLSSQTIKPDGADFLLQCFGHDRPTSRYPKGRFNLQAVEQLGWQLDRLLVYRQDPSKICFRLPASTENKPGAEKEGSIFEQHDLRQGRAELDYQHRYRVEDIQNGQPCIYWLYERVRLQVALLPNPACLNDQQAADIFSQPTSAQWQFSTID